jgi:hypothetical protein
MIAAVILLVVMFWLTQYYVLGRKHLDYEEQRRKATAVAQGRLDETREWAYSYLKSFVGGAAPDTTFRVDGRDYAVRIEVDPGPNPHTVTVRAIVSWEATLEYDRGNTFSRQDTTTTILGRAL